MDEYKDIDKGFQELLDKAEEMGWTSRVYVEKSRYGRKYVELEKYSPAGENFNMTIDFDEKDQAVTFQRELQQYANEFDPEEHAEMWLESRGKRGVPSSIRTLLEDAEEIGKMIEELADATYDILYPELTDEQAARNDEIYNAAYEFCKVVSEDDNLKWDMYYIGELAELAAELMVKRGYKVRFPSIVTDGDRQYIEEYYQPEKEEA